MEKRVEFDFEIFFTNGGSIRGDGFRLDIEGNDISDRVLADYIVADMRLLMAGETKILNKKIITEPHKRKPVNAAREKRIIDLSHTIENGMVTIKDFPAPTIGDYLTREDSQRFYEPGTSFQISKFTMVANTGTYLDSPFHRYSSGADLSETALENITDLPGVVIRIPFTETLSIDATRLRHHEVRNRAVLIHTGWDTRWNSVQYHTPHPHLTEDAANYLERCAVRLVGIDANNIDNSAGKSRPAHTILLGAGIPIVEHLCNLKALPDEGFTFSAVPPKIRGAGTFPVRAYAKILKHHPHG